MNTIGIIDSHVHIFSGDVVKDRSRFFYDAQFKLLYESSKSQLYDKDLLIRSMDNTGVARSVCLGFSWNREEDCIRENDYILDAALKSEGKIIPFGSVPLDKKDGIEKYIKGMAESGFYGVGEIGFYSTGFGEAQQNYLKKLFAACETNNMRIVLHVNEPVGHIYTGKYHTDLSRLVSIISEYKKLKILLSHWGGGLFMYELMPELKEALSNVWYDTAATVYLYNSQIYRTAIESCGAKKILFGSDSPLIEASRYYKDILNLSEDTAAMILRRNALDFIS